MSTHSGTSTAAESTVPVPGCAQLDACLTRSVRFWTRYGTAVMSVSGHGGQSSLYAVELSLQEG